MPSVGYPTLLGLQLPTAPLSLVIPSQRVRPSSSPSMPSACGLMVPETVAASARSEKRGGDQSLDR